jgi:hypothetical protein
VGAERLHALYRVLVGLMPRARAGAAGWRLELLPAMQRVTVALSLTLLPAAATLPYAYQRVDWLSSVLAARRENTAAHAGSHLVPLVLPETRRTPIAAHASTAHAAGEEAEVETAAALPPPLFEPEVWAMADEARPIMGVVELLRNHSEPGEPIFAYPAIPGIYYLADRPNATRFNHLFAGMASPADEEEMVRQLERVQWVVWDDEGVYTWVRPEDNAPVMTYLREHFGTSQKIGPYVVLRRGGTGAPRPVVPPVG